MDSRNQLIELTMNEFNARLAVHGGGSAPSEINIRCSTLALLSELVAHIELFKPGAVASAHRGLANVLAADLKVETSRGTDLKPEDDPATGADVGQVVQFTPVVQTDTRPDPATVFGGAGVPTPPAPAPSTAVAEAQQTAPTSSIPLPASPAPAQAPAPEAAAPAASATPTSPVARDADGVPWDHRIHAESKAVITDGTWRKRRNLPEGLHEQITAELKALAGVGSSPVAQAVALLPAGAPVNTAAVAQAEALVQSPAPSESTYAAFMGYLNTVMTGANIKLTIHDLANLIADTGVQFGLTEKLTLQSLKHASELIQTAARLEVEKFVAAKS